jgi:hypothetical protein
MAAAYAGSERLGATRAAESDNGPLAASRIAAWQRQGRRLELARMRAS